MGERAERVLGIDEAGRGCVLGDLFIGAFLVDGVTPETLSAAGARDSKRLSPRRRQAVLEALEPLGEAHLRRVSPEAIDLGNLNTLEETAIAGLVRALRPDRVIVDALGHPSTLPTIRARLQAAVAPFACAWLIVPKADRDHPVVGAASIVAKTARDSALDRLRETWGTLGSGYPSDPKTRAWLERHAATRAPWPAFVRTRWGTVRALEQVPLVSPD